jgi:N-acetylmuramoyl-L-alanine amidase
VFDSFFPSLSARIVLYGYISKGAIIDLQPWVQGAYGAGHVAVVEKVYSDGSVLASNMNWGANPYSVAYVHFHPGSGVTFIQW